MPLSLGSDFGAVNDSGQRSQTSAIDRRLRLTCASFALFEERAQRGNYHELMISEILLASAGQARRG
jgi:hypothetical protein